MIALVIVAKAAIIVSFILLVHPCLRHDLSP